MLQTRTGRFLGISLAIFLVALPLAVLFTPPDPYTQIVVAGSLFAFLLPVAYLLSHPTIYARLQQD